ncbi:MAG: polysaccharide biosynthesis tyrosine autokinase [Planctomycetaceae bacterium]
MSANPETLNLVDVIRRQGWLIVACVISGAACAVLYWMYSPVWYESRAKVLVSPKDTGLAGSAAGQQASESVVNEDILANHMEVVRSRRIVETALKKSGCDTLLSIVSRLDEKTDATDYVIEQLKLTRGGDGGARDARSLSIAFQHRDPEDCQRVLEAVVQEYQEFLGAQLQKAMSSADLLIREAQAEVEQELKAAEQEYVDVRTNAPVLFQGEGSSNVYFDQFRRLNDELLELQIQESSLKIRLDRVQTALTERAKAKETAADAKKPEQKNDDLDLLALIDGDSLERLGLFAGLQMSTARTAEFQATQPARLEQARTQYSHLLNLKSQEQRLRSDFGAEHPEVLKLKQEIELVQKFIAENSDQTSVPWEQEMNPETLISAYTGFLRHDLASIEDRKRELLILSAAAEKEAKSLVEFELKDEMLRSKIDRQQALFEGIVEQLRGLNLASGLSGYVHELLESPRYGEKIWPRLSLCGVGGILLGLIAGLVLAVANDQMDARFRSVQEIDEATDLRVLGRVGKLRAQKGITGLVANLESFDGEVFRSLRTVLLPDVKSGELRTLTATSSLSQDGKSTLLANLAVSFAQVKLDVLLIDADMRRPSVHEQFSLTQEIGLAGVLAGSTKLDDALKPSGISHLTVMTAGTIPKNPSELLESEAFDRLLDTLSETYRLILIDVGPVLAITDPCVIAQKTDAALLVVRPSNDSRHQAVEAVNRLRAVGAPLLGCVVNTFGSGKDFEQASGYGNYYGGYDKAYAKAAAKANGTTNGTTHGIVAPRLQSTATETTVSESDLVTETRPAPTDTVQGSAGQQTTSKRGSRRRQRRSGRS